MPHPTLQGPNACLSQQCDINNTQIQQNTKKVKNLGNFSEFRYVYIYERVFARSLVKVDQ